MRKKRNKVNKISVFIFVFLMFFLSIGYAAFSTTLKVNFDGNLKHISAAKLLKNNIVTSGDGLYADSTETDRYIFKGKNPNNYIKLGDDLYRIISVEKDNSVKIIKNDSIGSMAYDNATSGTRYSSVTTDYCHYTGSETGVYGCKVWGSKTTMRDKNGNLITTMPREIDGTKFDLPTTDSYINTYLNSTYYNSLSTDTQSKIVNHIFNVGLLADDSSDSLLINTNQEKDYTWQGKIALMNMTDYVKASTKSACSSVYQYGNNSACYNDSPSHNWLSSSASEWTLSVYPHDVDNIVWNISNIYSITNRFSSVTQNIRPVFFLTPKIYISGTGTSTDPYLVKE